MNRIAILGVLTALILGCGAAPEEPTHAASGKETGTVKEHKSGQWSPELSDEEKDALFAMARDTLEWCVKGSKGKFSFEKYKLTDKMKAPTHSFVTLKINGRLRGCIGSLPPFPAEAMYKSVHNHTVLSALRDTRFHKPFGPGPVAPGELSSIDIHISLLSPVKDIPSLDAFNIGEHGIILRKGRARAVYLPEVAVEQGWTKEQTLASLCRKAGMGPEDWREGAQFQVFSSVVLSK
jgi:AmmeMemoRadiSam system protein A